MCMETSGWPLRPQQEPSEPRVRGRWCSHPDVEATVGIKDPLCGWVFGATQTAHSAGDKALRSPQAEVLAPPSPEALSHKECLRPVCPQALPPGPPGPRRVWRPPAAFSSTIWAPKALNVVLPTCARQHLTYKLQTQVPPALGGRSGHLPKDTSGGRGAGMVHSLTGSPGHRARTYFSVLLPTTALLEGFISLW